MSKQQKHETVIGLDPGSPNFGATIFSTKGRLPKIKKTGILPTTINNLQYKTKKSKGVQYDSFEQEKFEFDEFVCQILDNYQPDLVGIERFQGRGLRGNLAELASFMIMTWLLRCQDRNINTRLVTPVEWKTQYDKTNRLRNLNSVYKDLQTHGIENHCVDSYLIGLYCYSLEENVDGIFDHILDNKKFDKLIKQMVENYS